MKQPFRLGRLALLLLPLAAQAREIPFEYYQRLIFLNVQVNGSRDLLFLLDTGSNASAIDTRVADGLGLASDGQTTIEGSAGIIPASTARVGSLAAGDAMVSDLSLSRWDLGGLLAPPGRRVEGILGTDFLSRFAVRIDFPATRLTIAAELPEAHHRFLPFQLDNGIPMVEALIADSIPVFLRYDSGSSLFATTDIYLHITRSVLDALKARDRSLRPVKTLTAKGIGGMLRLPVYRVPSVVLGPLELAAPFLVVQPAQGYFARADAVGFFGNGVLEKYRTVTVDFANCRIGLGV